MTTFESSARATIATYEQLYTVAAPRSALRRQCRDVIASVRKSLRAERNLRRVERETAGAVRMASAIAAK